jgi:hypothetical protein
MGAVITPMVIRVRPMMGSGTWKESGCMTKIVERRNDIGVAMAKLLISVIRKLRILGKKSRSKVFISLHTGPQLMYRFKLVWPQRWWHSHIKPKNIDMSRDLRYI